MKQTEPKLKLPQELAFLLAIVTMTLGVALMQKANLGLSMIVAPAYMLSEMFGINFGTAEYCLQFVLVSVMCFLIRQFRITYYLSFVTAVIYGFALDGFIWLLRSDIPAETLSMQLLLTLLGMIVTAVGVALFFHTYLPACAYDQFVKIVSQHFHISTGKFKICYDFSSLAVALILSFCFFGKLMGIGIGTFICVCLNGVLISFFSMLLDRFFTFSTCFPRLEKTLT